MWILGKGKRERQLHPLAAPAVAAIRRYLAYRGTNQGPLFKTRGNRGKARDGRLETRSVSRILRILGDKIGIHLRPHGLRHTSISQASELGQRAGIPLERIRAHSRHASIVTLVRYTDEHQREQTAQSLADLVAGELSRVTPD
jgi:integrase/recombinase XerC